MKWIGQHIWDFISRFRSDVYMEAIESGTIASGGNLGLDSNNKVVKAAEVGSSVDLTSEVTGTLPVSNGGTGTTNLSDNHILVGNGSSAIQTTTDFKYYTSTETLRIGDLDDGEATIARSQGSSSGDAGGTHGDFSIKTYYAAGLYNMTGGALNLYGGWSSGSGFGGDVKFYTYGQAYSSPVGSQQGETPSPSLKGSFTQTGLYLAEDSTLMFEGGTDNGYETTLTVSDPSADRTITLPNATGTVALTSDIAVTTLNGSTSDGLTTYNSSNTLDVESTLRYDGSTNMLMVTGSGAPGLYLDQTGANSADPHIEFYNSRGAGSGVDDDDCGTLVFYGNNNAGTAEKIQYGNIRTTIRERDDGDEAGIMRLQVATSDDSTSGVQQALTATGHATANTVDIGLGYGTTSTTTLAGGLTVGGSVAAMTNAGLVSVAAQTNITSLGTLTNLQVDDVNINTKSIEILGDTSDTFNITTGGAGATTISTTDAGGEGGSITVQPDGDLNLRPATNKINKVYDFHGTTFENTYSAGGYSGTVLKYDDLGDTSLTAGQLYYLRSTNGSWVLADADSGTSSDGMLGVGLGGGSRTVGILIEGFISIPASEILNTPSDVHGEKVYIASGTDGHFDFTAPSNPGDIVRIVGYAIDDDSGNVLIHFNPDKTYIERG